MSMRYQDWWQQDVKVRFRQIAAEVAAQLKQSSHLPKSQRCLSTRRALTVDYVEERVARPSSHHGLFAHIRLLCLRKLLCPLGFRDGICDLGHGIGIYAAALYGPITH